MKIRSQNRKLPTVQFSFVMLEGKRDKKRKWKGTSHGEFGTLVETKNGRRDLVNDLEPSFNSQHGYPQERSKDFLSSSISDGAFNAEIILLVLLTSFQDTIISAKGGDVIFKVCSNIAVDCVRHLGNFIELSKRVSLPIWFLLHSMCYYNQPDILKENMGRLLTGMKKLESSWSWHMASLLSVRDH